MAYPAIQSSFGLLRWPFLASPRTPEGGGEPKFAATFVAGGPSGLRPGDQEFLQALMKQMDEACIAKWNVGVDGMRQRLMAQNKVFNLALKRNSDPSRSKHAGIAAAPDGFHFEAKSKFAPDVFDATANKLAAADPTLFYDGAVVRVFVSAYVYDHPKSGPGVGLNLNGVQFAQHGPRLGGVEIKAAPVDPSAMPSDLPQAPAPNMGATPVPAPAYGQPGQPPAASPEASYGHQPQNPPNGGGSAGGFGF